MRPCARWRAPTRSSSSTTPPIPRCGRWSSAPAQRTSTPDGTWGSPAGSTSGRRAGSPRARDVLLLNPDAAIAPDGVAAPPACAGGRRPAGRGGAAPARSRNRRTRPGSAGPSPRRSARGSRRFGLGGLRRGPTTSSGRSCCSGARPSTTSARSTTGSSSTPKRPTGSAGPPIAAGRSPLCPGVTATHVGSGTGGAGGPARDPLPRVPRALPPQAPRHRSAGGLPERRPRRRRGRGPWSSAAGAAGRRRPGSPCTGAGHCGWRRPTTAPLPGPSRSCTSC